jgi:hypothetical protein
VVVGVQHLGRRRVPEAGLDSPDALAVTDQQRRLVVAQDVAAGTGRCAPGSHRRPPGPLSKASPTDRLAKRIHEQVTARPPRVSARCCARASTSTWRIGIVRTRSRASSAVPGTAPCPAQPLAGRSTVTRRRRSPPGRRSARARALPHP